MVSAAASEPAAVVSAAAAVVSYVFWLLPHAVKDNAKTAAVLSAKILFFIMCLLLNYICLFPVFSVFAARTDQILFIDTGQILSAAVSGYVVFPVLI